MSKSISTTGYLVRIGTNCSVQYWKDTEQYISKLAIRPGCLGQKTNELRWITTGLGSNASFVQHRQEQSQIDCQLRPTRMDCCPGAALLAGTRAVKQGRPFSHWSARM